MKNPLSGWIPGRGDFYGMGKRGGRIEERKTEGFMQAPGAAADGGGFAQGPGVAVDDLGLDYIMVFRRPSPPGATVHRTVAFRLVRALYVHIQKQTPSEWMGFVFGGKWSVISEQ